MLSAYLGFPSTGFVLYRTAKTWEDASKACKAANGWLATIQTVQEQKAVEAILRAVGNT